MAKKPTAPAPAADQPYYLQRAHIKDFRSIRDAAVEFKPGLNIIIGPNGSGKTNFVSILSSAIGDDILPVEAGSNFQLSGRKKISISYNRDLEKDDKQSSFLNPYAFNLYKNKNNKSVLLNINDFSIEGPSLDYALFEYNKLFIDSIENQYKYEIIDINHGTPQDYNLIQKPAEISLDNKSIGHQGATGKFAKSLISSISTTVYFKTIHDSLLIKDKAAKLIISSVANKYIELIKPYLIKFTPISDIKVSGSLQVFNDSAQNELLVRGLTFEFKANSNWLPFDSLSSGTQRLFYIISEIIGSKNLYLQDIEHGIYVSYDDKEDKIILLEEPELGIHPHQLHLLLNFLREQSEKHQLIITTHSPQVLDMLHEDELDRITICELHKTKGTQFRKLKKTQLADAKRYMQEVGFLSDYWRMGDLEAAK